MNPASFLVGIVSFLLYIVMYLLLLRVKSPVGWLWLEIAAGILAFGVGMGFGYWFIDYFSIYYALSIFGFFWFCFFFISGIFYVSVSVGIIHYLSTRPQKSSSIDDLYIECIVKPFVNRIDLMEKSGLVDKSQHGYVITQKGEYSATRIKKLQSILGLKSQVFYSIDTINKE